MSEMYGSSLYIDTNWDVIKLKLKHEYQQLTDEDLLYQPGREKQLLNTLQQKLDIKREEVISIVENI